jgi:endonuclease YncB( thermonuclease family)
MRRRTFLSVLGAGTAAAATGNVAASGDGIDDFGSTSKAANQHIEALAFVSGTGFLDENGEPLSDDSIVAVYSEPTATMIEKDGNDDVVEYPDDTPIPLVTIENNVIGIGAPFLDGGGLIPEFTGDDVVDLGNEELMLNLVDEYADGDTILWDESHGQFYGLYQFTNFEAYAENQGYTVEATEDLTADLSDANAVVIQGASDAFSDAEISALSEFADDGGAVFLHSQSDFSNFDTTDNLNAIAEGLGVGFRFNDGEVNDPESNLGIGYNLRTSNFNRETFDVFADREGIVVDIQPDQSYEVSIAGFSDGDTFDVTFPAETVGLEADFTASVRVLGIDTPESAGVAQTAERPEEWEGLAYDLDGISSLTFGTTASLLDGSGQPVTDDAGIVVSSEDTATIEDSDGNGDAVSYPEGAEIPLVAEGGTVVGIGSVFVADEEGSPPPSNNVDFLLNYYDELVGSGTVLWDEGHSQFDTLDNFSNFESAAEEAGYTVEPTTDLQADLSGADAVVIMPPSDSFSDAELSALSDFADDGGAVFLHNKGDFNDFDETANLNAIADELDTFPFRFNDAQVTDEQNNAGQPFVPTTSAFAGDAALFQTRGAPPNTNQYLLDRASAASDWVESELEGKTLRISFDENEPMRDPTRLLAYAEYDSDGDDSYDTLYNEKAIEEGYARAYGSSLSRHDEFWAAENEAREAGRGVWAESDVSSASPYREGPVEELFLPDAASVRTTSGGVDADRVPVAAASTASQDGGSVSYGSDVPLAAIDDRSQVALVGSPIVDEGYEAGEGYPVDTSGYGNYAFLSNLLEYLSNRDGGPVYIDGGHGQFGVSYALSSEDAAYFQRHLEGEGYNLEQINDLTQDRLSNARALVVSTPVSELSTDELASLRSYRDDGGAIVLLGSADAPSEARSNLNAVAEGLGSDLRLNDDRVTDDTNNLDDDPQVPTTTNFNTDVAVFTDVLEMADTDGDGEIETEEFSRAVSKWIDGDYTRAQLQRILNAWITGS